MSWDTVFDETGYNSALEQYQRDIARYNSTPAPVKRATPMGYVMEGGHRGQLPTAPNRSDYVSRSDQANVNVSLDPDDQRLLDAYRGLAVSKIPELEDTLGSPFDFQSVTDVRDHAESALMDRLNPYLDRDIADKRTQLLQGGFSPGTEGWNREMDDYNRRSNDARLAVIGQAGTEQDRALATASYLRGLPLQEINALRTGGNIGQPSFPAFQGSSANPADILGATNQQYQGEVAAYNADAANRSGFFGGLTNLASAALPFASGGFSSLGIPGAGIWAPGGAAASNAGPVQLSQFGY